MFDSPAVSEEQQLIRETIREFAENEIRPVADESDHAERFPRTIFAGLCELGFPTLPFSEEKGGGGAGWLACLLALEEVASADAGVAVALAAHTVGACAPLVRLGTPEQRERWLTPLLTGEAIGAFGHAEPGDVEVNKSAKGWHLRGQLDWVVNGGVADTLVCLLETRDGDCLFCLSRGSEGVTREPIRGRMGLRSMDVARVVFDEAAVPEDSRISLSLAPEERRFLGALGDAALAITGCGLARAGMEASARYAQERIQFGRPIAAFPAIQNKLGAMAARLQSARGLAHGAAHAWDGGEDGSAWALAARIAGLEAAHFSGKESVQVHGGNGYTRDYPAERYYRDAQVLSAGFDGRDDRSTRRLGERVVESQKI